MIDTSDANGWQPLHEAVKSGNLELVTLLVDHDADLGALTSNGGSPRWWAVELLGNNHEISRYLAEIDAPY
jgi:ankyrin repeat protein